jgi:hypothetical protein
MSESTASRAVRRSAARRLAIRFEEHTDPDTPYLFHCHLLRHHDGMMGQFVVVGPGQRPEPGDHRAHAHAPG